MAEKFKKTILIDLDGVLNTYTGNFDKNFIPKISKEELDMLNADIQIGIDDADKGNVSNAFDFLKELKTKYE